MKYDIQNMKDKWRRLKLLAKFYEVQVVTYTGMAVVFTVVIALTLWR